MRMRGERKIMKFFFFFFFYINIHTWKYFAEHSSRELNEFEQKDQLRMELSKFRWHEFRCRATILPLSLSFLAWGVGGDPLRFDVPTAIIYDFCRWRKQSTVNWGRYVWSSVLSKWIELAAPANISLSTDRCSLSTIPMIIIYFAYPVYRFKADDYIPETNEKKEFVRSKLIFLQTFHILIVSQFVRKKNILFQSHQSTNRRKEWNDCKTLTKRTIHEITKEEGRLVSSVLISSARVSSACFSCIYIASHSIDRSFFSSSISLSLSKRALWPPISVDKTA